MPMEKKKVLVAISGGVDSAVAAALLIKQGYAVTGAFMKCYSEAVEKRACWIDDRRDALRVCAKLGIKLLDFDFEKEYRRRVVKYLFAEYRAGRTPNPDVMCNKFVKFPLLWRAAKKMGFDYLATGHYAQIGWARGRAVLLKAKDKNKDQTYFLHQIKQTELRQTLFPIGGYTKPEVRELAREFGLPVAEKEESMGICFIGEISINDFLRKKIKPRPGKIVLPDGKEVGKHTGLPFYTIGQRSGLGIGGGRALFVVAKNRHANKLVVDYEDSPLLFQTQINVNQVSWLSGQKPSFPLKCEVRMRHRQPLQKCIIHCHSERSEAESRNPLTVKFAKPQRAVTPGQFAVFYQGEVCLGGGVVL